MSSKTGKLSSTFKYKTGVTLVINLLEENRKHLIVVIFFQRNFLFLFDV